MLLIEDKSNWYSTPTHHAKCDVISGQKKKFKLKYFINKMLECKTTRKILGFKFNM